jgi:hypothetical protein
MQTQLFDEEDPKTGWQIIHKDGIVLERTLSKKIKN